MIRVLGQLDFEISGRREAIFLMVTVCVPGLVLILGIIAAGWNNYRSGPCWGYTGLVPAVAVDGKCTHIPIKPLW